MEQLGKKLELYKNQVLEKFILCGKLQLTDISIEDNNFKWKRKNFLFFTWADFPNLYEVEDCLAFYFPKISPFNLSLGKFQSVLGPKEFRFCLVTDHQLNLPLLNSSRFSNKYPITLATLLFTIFDFEKLILDKYGLEVKVTTDGFQLFGESH